MSSTFQDRLLTIVVTATLTSAAWIVVGSTYVDLEGQSLTSARKVTADAQEARAAPAAGTTTATLPAERETAKLVVPVANVRPSELADTFKDDRGGGARLHEAIDIMAPSGTPVIAAAPGKIERLFLSEAGGNTVYVRSPDGKTVHYYAHLQSYAKGLREGQQVQRGQQLGTVGVSGNADPAAPHLHFAVLRTTPDADWWEPATAINPYPLFTRR